MGLLILGFGWRSEPTCDECYWVTCAEPSVKRARSADELRASEDISSNMHRLSGLLCTFSSYYRLANFTLRGTSMSPWIVLSTTGWAASFAGADMCLHMALSRSFDLWVRGVPTILVSCTRLVHRQSGALNLCVP